MEGGLGISLVQNTKVNFDKVDFGKVYFGK